MDADRQTAQLEEERARVELIRREMEAQQKRAALFRLFQQQGLLPVPQSNDNPFMQLVRPPIIQPNTPQDLHMTHKLARG